jgi:hypothetical protein
MRMIACEGRQVVDEREVRVGSQRRADIIVVVRQPRLHSGILQGPWIGTDGLDFVKQNRRVYPINSERSAFCV